MALRGEIAINGVKMKQGDGAEVTNEKELAIDALSDAEVLIIDVPSHS